MFSVYILMGKCMKARHIYDLYIDFRVHMNKISKHMDITATIIKEVNVHIYFGGDEYIMSTRKTKSNQFK